MLPPAAVQHRATQQPAGRAHTCFARSRPASHVDIAAAALHIAAAPRFSRCHLRASTSETPPTTTRQDAALCAQGPPTNCAPVPAEQAAWESLYDGTGGATQWAGCKANRQDPCGCSYVYNGARGVTCSADGQHILKL